jgi:NAD(P)-dependent dehydrogenase (short-subunit alcohol dehydrogenase family)
MIDFEGRVAIVTGAGRGLGRAHARLLAMRGASVVVCDVGSATDGQGGAEEIARQVVDEIQRASGNAVAATASVATAEGGAEIVQTALDTFGRIDIVVNNAGILRDRSFANLSDDDISAVLAVHLHGAFNVTRPAWPHMKAQGYGRVLNTTSSSGLLGTFGQGNYGAAKMGVVGLTRVQAIEGRRYGIQANALAPMARTRMTEEILGDLVEALDPELVAPVAAWLVHEDCPVTGEVYSAAGGRVARFFVGLTPGYFKSDLTLEDVRDHFDEARDAEGYFVPESSEGEIEYVRQVLAQAGAPG